MPPQRLPLGIRKIGCTPRASLLFEPQSLGECLVLSLNLLDVSLDLTQVVVLRFDTVDVLFEQELLVLGPLHALRSH